MLTKKARVVLCAVLVGIVIGPVAMLYLALSAHWKPVDRPANVEPVIVVRSV